MCVVTTRPYAVGSCPRRDRRPCQSTDGEVNWAALGTRDPHHTDAGGNLDPPRHKSRGPSATCGFLRT